MIDSLALVKTPAIARKIFRKAIWRASTKKKTLYLTFDDGPQPGVTGAVLDLLNQYNAKATFFCIGKNIEENPELFQRIIAEGHTAGNHTQQHLNGWKTNLLTYLDDVKACDAILDAQFAEATNTNNKRLFRPPYGKLTFPQYNYLKQRYQVVMWDVLSFDFDLKETKERVLENVIRHAENGSVIVFHDSKKAAEKVLFALPAVLQHFHDAGYSFQSLNAAAVANFRRQKRR
ncbi:MAG: polysaccharide deacetylase family protein [Chitinophagales bacterium]